MKRLEQLRQKAQAIYPFLTKENFYRIMLLFHGIAYKNQDSFPDPFTRIEVTCLASQISKVPFLLLLKPHSPFYLIDSERENRKILLFENEFVDEIENYEQQVFNMRNQEPFYFFVREINGDVVLKLNPIQLCDFYQNASGNLPCSFCFRNDMVSRFRNIDTKNLVSMLVKEKESLGITDEVSIITGSYTSDEKYREEVSSLVSQVKPLIPKNARIVVGSYEGKTKKTFERLKDAGVTEYTFPVESFNNDVRKSRMKNRKGVVRIEDILEDIASAVSVFGQEHVIVRSIVGLGDPIDDELRNTVSYISRLGVDATGPMWNVNVYMPFTHYHNSLFERSPVFDLDYLFSYCSLINEYVPEHKYIRFKISP